MHPRPATITLESKVDRSRAPGGLSEPGLLCSALFRVAEADRILTLFLPKSSEQRLSGFLYFKNDMPRGWGEAQLAKCLRWESEHPARRGGSCL